MVTPWPQGAAPTGPAWEFRVVQLDVPYQASELQLNLLGAEGWCAFSVIDRGGDYIFAFLQRPKRESAG